MASGKRTALPLALLVALCAATTFTDASGINGKPTHVLVRNRLPPGKTFTIHCKSKDNDLRVHTIGTTLEYGFQFHSNIWGTTLFFCGVSTDYGSGVYDIYKASRDGKRCTTNCNWDVTPEGLYGYKQGAEFPDLHLWWTKPPQS